MGNLQLTVQVSEHSVRFVQLKNDVVLHDAQLTWDQNSGVNEKKEALNSTFENHSFLNEEHEEVTLSWVTKRSTLIPNNVFAETSARAVYELCFGKGNDAGEIDYNRIAELSIINVFDIPDWVKRYFVLKFPRLILQHEGSHVLRQIMHSNAFYLKSTVILHKDYFMLTIAKHNALEFYSYFDYQSAEDILYHTLFTLQQKELTNEQGILELIAGIDASNATIDQLKNDLQRIQDLKDMTIDTPRHFTAKAQLLCV